MSKWAFAILGVCLILGGCANNNAEVAQAKPPDPCKQLSAPRVANQPRYRQLTISLGSSGDAPTKLSQDDLKINTGNQEIPVQFFQQEAVSVGILVDTSGSMDPKMRQARTTLAELIDGLNPDDEAFLMAFSSRPFMLQAFTSNHTWLKRRVDLLHAFGQTSLFDSTIQGLRLVERGCYEHKALFLMTDGIDNTSSVNQSAMLAAVKESKVRIFALGIGNEEPQRALFIGPFALGGDNANTVDARTLRSLADTSGGKSYILPELGNAKAKQTALAIANGIDNHYAIGFVAPANSRIQIELLHHSGATLKIDSAPPGVTVVKLSRS